MLLPVNFCDRRFQATPRRCFGAAFLAQFADVPATRNTDKVTLLEEDKITAYYGGGTLYATPDRVEPLL